MQQLLAVWQNLDMRRRAIVIAATIAVFIGVLTLSAMASKPSMALLYAGLEGSEAGEVVTALEQRGATYEVRGDSIYVESIKRDELRMMLAGEGLPATGSAGYELLDNLSGFGTTSQMFDAAYWRAKEGELARTIIANPSVRSARVHISNPSARSFRNELRPTASVTVTTLHNGLGSQQAKAMRFLVASAVSGLEPEDVSIIDSEKGLVSSGDDEPSAFAGDDRAAEFKANVERLLEARVGYGNAIVEVSVETVTEREAITERLIDPSGRVAISTDLEERSKNANDTKPGAVSVASNLPEGDGANGGKSQSQSSETRERTNYEVSETTRELLRTPGSIKRVTVAVLVDGLNVTDGAGNTSWQPRSEQELGDLRELVASTVGYTESRGDVITIRSMAFEPVLEEGTLAEPGLLAGAKLDIMQIIQLVVAAIVALVLGLFVMRPILTQAPVAVAGELPAPETASSDALTGEIEDTGSDLSDGNFPALGFGGFDMPMAMGNGFGDDATIADPVDRIKKLIEERQSETVEILRSWMENEGERA